MVEVFKTDLKSHAAAAEMIGAVHAEFPHCKVTVDLDDCDRIFRIQCDREIACVERVLTILTEGGCNAQLLPDELPA